MAQNRLDEEFVESQRRRLEGLEAELRRMVGGMETDERERADDEGDLTENDSGDMSRDIFTREMDATVEGQMEARLGDVRRALRKIDEGTYGICDDTGEPIPEGRLKAMPEAIRTVEAQQRRDGER